MAHLVVLFPDERVIQLHLFHLDEAFFLFQLIPVDFEALLVVHRFDVAQGVDGVVELAELLAHEHCLHVSD